MKLWIKIFIPVVILFIAVFYCGIFLMSTLSYKSSLEIARGQAFAEHEFLISSFSNDLNAILNRDLEDYSSSVESLIAYYINYYKKQNVSICLVFDGKVVSENIPGEININSLSAVDDKRISVIQSTAANKYILVSGEINEDYVLIYCRDITLISNAHNNLTRRLMICELLITFAFIVLLYFIANGLTKPVRNLQSVTKKIAAGDMDARAEIKGNDEITDLAVCFNDMADEVQSKFIEHKAVAIQKQQFIDNLAHELKTPLTAIYGYAELLQRTKASEEELIEITFNIMQDVKRIQSMQKKLLDLALTRKVINVWETVLLEELFEKVHRELFTRLDEKNLNLIIKCELSEVCGDAVLLENLIINLLDNAVKASYVGGTIYLSSCTADNFSIIEVRDEGVGIPAEHVNSIFEPFYKTDFSRTGSKGAGLGLALCKQITDAHNAEIKIDSEIGVGTVFKIFFRNE